MRALLSCFSLLWQLHRYRPSFHHNSTDVRGLLPPAVSVCCNACVWFLFAVVICFCVEFAVTYFSGIKLFSRVCHDLGMYYFSFVIAMFDSMVFWNGSPAYGQTAPNTCCSITMWHIGLYDSLTQLRQTIYSLLWPSAHVSYC